MTVTTTVKNWEIGTSTDVLDSVHKNEVNIVIYERETTDMTQQIDHLLTKNIELRASGDIDSILSNIKKELASEEFSLIIQDIKNLLHLFKKATQANSFRLLLATINTNMCRKFHTDINDLRMLCTYSGPGTLWLTEDNINHKELDALGDNKNIVISEDKVQQVKTGSVVILKGAIYPHGNTEAVVHRSPTIEESGEKRLLLRIDNNECIKFE